MMFIEQINGFQLVLMLSLIPGVFFFLWALIFSDIKNFIPSGQSCRVFSAKDPVNCYQNYESKKTN